ncbi:DUF262 domain-containing protein [Acinetobacter calcoaceticus]|uniref:DUF262 domain-containing protein n=1 Tax=Acinetobacter calcoaceticus TaxID=471 RepID=UPI00192BD43F|nr:DUF262 domain-containing protein [Acinetobacter calcoaceticus]
MTFEQLLSDIRMMIGIELQAINPHTPSITLISLDTDANRYVVKSNDTGKELSRNIRELRSIFDELNKNRYCNVEQVLQGANTSRHHPETIFANLPYIQFFKFDKRKHLILIDNQAHKLGEIEELSLKDQRWVRNAITANKSFNISETAFKISSIVKELDKEVENLHIKIPGFLVETTIPKILKELSLINESIQVATLIRNNKQTISETLENIEDKRNFDLSDLVDLSEITGIDEGVADEPEDSLSEQESKNKDIQELQIPNIRRQTPSLALLYDRLRYEEIEIQPEYQRKDRIWDDKRKSRLIESILMGLPLPIFYFGERIKNDHWIVIDGLQRLTTIQDFMKGDFSLKLDEDSPLLHLNGKNYRDFDRKEARSIREYEITAYVIDVNEEYDNNGGEDRFIIELFHRINTYGVRLSEQEIRSAINFGTSVYYLKFLASSKTFIKATAGIVNPQRQKDVELCLTAMAFIIFGYKDFNTNSYNSFLSSAMKWINEQSFKKVEIDGHEDYQSDSVIINKLTQKFESSLNLCIELFGEHAFKKTRDLSKKTPVSKQLFEVLVTIFANITEDQKEKIINNKVIFVDTLYTAIENNSREYAAWESANYQSFNDRGLNYALSTSTGKRVTILYRFESIIEILKRTTDCTVEIQTIVNPK